MPNFTEILHIIDSLKNESKVISLADLEKERKIQKYIRGLRQFGPYPTLVLLKEYEDDENYMECSYIFQAVNRQFERLKIQIPSIKDKPFPTHIDQFTDKMYKNMFDAFGLTGETAKKNTQAYVEAIKKMK